MPNIDRSKTAVRSEGFELDLRTGELRKDGAQTLRLSEQPLRILIALLERPGELVLREDLRKRLWPNVTVVEFEHGIGSAVNRLRAHSVAPGAQAKRFAAYLDRLALAAEHDDRATPLKSYCTGLWLPGERKSVEPMAARLCPDNVRQTHQSMHHLVADAAWSDEDVLEAVRAYVLPAMQQKAPIVAWIVDDTGFVKKGQHSVGVTRQYCGPVGKQENCRVAVSLSVSTEQSSLPIAWRLYLPEVWAQDGKRRKKTGVPGEIRFQIKPAIALEQIRAAVQRETPVGVVLSDAAYGTVPSFARRSRS